MVKPLKDRCFHHFIKSGHIDYHARVGCDGTANEHLNYIVVPVAVGVVAFAIDLAI
jgi:hypothetical protein